MFYDSVLNEDERHARLEGFDTTVSVGALLEIGLAISNIATAVVLFPMHAARLQLGEQRRQSGLEDVI